MSLEKLSKYKVNKAFTEGVDIYLDDAPDVCFKVRLPGQYNRQYMAEMYGAIEVSFDDGEATTKTNVLQARDVQEKAFINHCLLSIDGEPIPDGFADEYPSALEELIIKANDLSEALTSRVDDAAKKSAPSLIGKSVGAAS